GGSGSAPSRLLLLTMNLQRGPDPTFLIQLSAAWLCCGQPDVFITPIRRRHPRSRHVERIDWLRHARSIVRNRARVAIPRRSLDHALLVRRWVEPRKKVIALAGAIDERVRWNDRIASIRRCHVVDKPNGVAPFPPTDYQIPFQPLRSGRRLRHGAGG